MRHLILTFAIALIVTTVSAEEGGNLTAKQWTASNTGGQISTVMISPGHDISVDEEVSASVALFGRDGTVYRGKASDDSNLGFEFDRVPAGVYTLVARGPNLVACYALHVVHASADEAADHRQLIEVSAADIGIGTVRSAVIRYTPSTVEPASKYTAAEAQRMLNAQNNNQLSGVVRSVSDFSGQINQAGLVDGNLVGAAMTNVLVYDDSGMVAQTISDDQGSHVLYRL